MQVVTLSTDIGLNDFLVGAIKGQILSELPSANINDITHQLQADNYLHAAYICKNAFTFFPASTIHLLIINLFEKTPSRFLLYEYKKQFIICPDNGILTMIAGSKPANVFSLPLRKSCKTVLHCTALLAKAIVTIAEKKTPDGLGSAVDNIEEKYPFRSTLGPDWIDSQIIFIDHFENVVVNITEDEFEEQRKGRRFKIVLPARNDATINIISNNYADVPEGETLACFNSAGYLELAINKGNLAGLFGLKKYSGTPINGLSQHKLMYERVRIFFE